MSCCKGGCTLIMYDVIKNCERQREILRKEQLTDADKLEIMLLDINPYSRYGRMGMKKALRKAIRLLKKEEQK